MKKHHVYLIIFLVASLGDIISLAADFNVRYLFKPAIIPSLVGYYLSITNQRNAIFLRALFFCWVGDFVLMFADQDQLYFIIGLIAFLIGHLFYIFSFRQLVWQQESTVLPTQKIRYTFPILLAGTGLMVVLYPVLGDLRMPVMLYAIILMLMVTYALFRIGRTTRSSFSWVFIGAILFMLSDSLLAINKFYSSFYMASIFIMVTYIAAQYMIVKGTLLHQEKTN
jgi:uncharacterized membrane protein YhhN